MLMVQHVEALYTHDAAGRIVRVRAQNGAPAPRLFIGRTSSGVICRCGHDIDDALCSALQACAADDAVDLAAEAASDGRAVDRTRYTDLLSRAAPVTKTWSGPAFRFPGPISNRFSSRDPAVRTVLVTEANVDILCRLLPAWVPDVHSSAPLMAVVVDGHAVAVCGSVRITVSVHEAGVDTAPAFRGHGHAPRVVAAWAAAVRAVGAEPLYSTAWENTASRGVARKLGLELYGTDLSFS
jgi:GNAT superfamily N-acetyltransferase